MNLEQVGAEIRKARLAHGLTQAQLAADARITRTTINQLENGTLNDLGLRKVEAIVGRVGLVLHVAEAPAHLNEPDFLHQASVSASVGFKAPLTERDLVRALVTGKIPAGHRPHLRKLLEEAPRALLDGLIRQVASWARPGKVDRNLDKIAATLGFTEAKEKRWKTG